MSEREWVEYFEAVNGRKPTATEFLKGKGKEFEVVKVQTQVNQTQSDSQIKKSTTKKRAILGGSFAALVLVICAIFIVLNLNSNPMGGRWYAVDPSGYGDTFVLNVRGKTATMAYIGPVNGDTTEEIVFQGDIKNGKPFNLDMVSRVVSPVLYNQVTFRLEDNNLIMKVGSNDLVFFRDGTSQGKTAKGYLIANINKVTEKDSSFSSNFPDLQ